MNNLSSSPHLYPLLALDTTSGSILHKLFDYACKSTLGAAFPLLTIYIASVVVTFFPLLIVALLDPLSLTEVTEEHKLPFLFDWNVLFMFLISFPSLVVCIVNDHNILLSSLKRVKIDEALMIDEGDASRLCVLWQRRFCRINYIGQILGVIIGTVVAYINYIAYTPAKVGYWIAENNNLLPVGFVFLYCIFLFYCLIPVLILRIISVALLLRDIVKHSHLRIQPLHPDKSGGFRPISRLALRNQYLLTIFCFNIILMMVPLHYLQASDALYGLTVAAVIVYLILAPVTFIALLLPFHKGMLSAKSKLMAPVVQQLCIELERLDVQMRSGTAITKEEEDLIERLQKIGSVIDQLPVWPVDTGTLRSFFIVYVIPVISSLIVKVILGLVKNSPLLK